MTNRIRGAVEGLARALMVGALTLAAGAASAAEKPPNIVVIMGDEGMLFTDY